VYGESTSASAISALHSPAASRPAISRSRAVTPCAAAARSRDEDEWFYVTEGQLTFWIGGEVIDAATGSFVYGPRGVPHTFLVSSPEARFLLVTEPAGLEGSVRELSEPAVALTLPPAVMQPPSRELMMAAAARYGLQILGPPGTPA
jgi:Cupin domain